MRLETLRSLEEAIERYNRYRAPEARAELLLSSGNRAEVLFSGPFCRTCGVTDWIEDLVFVLSELGVKARLVEIRGSLEDESLVGLFEIEES
ncbi:MAG: hypothetical protein QW405_03870 [Fervidicoccaceae archaeon]